VQKPTFNIKKYPESLFSAQRRQHLEPEQHPIRDLVGIQT